MRKTKASKKAQEKLLSAIELIKQKKLVEAFSKFGSDLDAATMAVLEKGKRNVEILKQDQYSPMSVEKQVAIIYCGTKGLLNGVAIEKVKEFETEYLEYLELKHKDLLTELAQGKLSDKITETLEKVAKDIAEKYN